MKIVDTMSDINFIIEKVIPNFYKMKIYLDGKLTIYLELTNKELKDLFIQTNYYKENFE